MSNIINKQRRYGFFSFFPSFPFFRESQYLSKRRDREFLCLILWGSVHVYVREMRRRDWKGEDEEVGEGGSSVGSIGMDAPGSFRGWCHWWRSRSILPATVCLWGRDSETGQGDAEDRYKCTSGGSACRPKHAERSTVRLLQRCRSLWRSMNTKNGIKNASNRSFNAHTCVRCNLLTFLYLHVVIIASSS